MTAVLPGARFGHVDVRIDPATGDDLTFDVEVTATDDAAPEARLPLEIMVDAPTGSVEERFAAAPGPGPASIVRHGTWPDDPAANQYGLSTYDGVQVVFRAEHAQERGWAEQHTVFVHVTARGDPPRAERLAAHIGSEVPGGARPGW
ncbi:hypothetical protein ACFWBB_10885 [Streptomyces sp. NPDC060000]|uniref:hypothetical protein n=1 Tax=Streptomyces sp. NPDC060000 TaxID=3347031 RepID=UPI0036B1A806